jgi:hypothetical protein
MMRAKTEKKYLDMIKSTKVITENEIRSLKTFINKRARANQPCYEFTTFKPKKITDAQSLKGLNWLRFNLLKADGAPRRANRLNLNDYEKSQFIKAVTNFKHWRFTGFYEVSSLCTYFVPWYELTTKQGMKISYAVSGQGVICEVRV